MPPQDSTRNQGQSHRNTHSAANTFDQPQSRMYPVPSHGSFHFSSAKSDITARSNSPDAAALLASSQLEAFDYNTFLGDDMTSAQSMFQRNSNAGGEEELINLSMPGPSFSAYATAGEESFASSYPVVSESLMYPSFAHGLPWDNSAVVELLEPQRLSPTLSEGAWSNSQHSNSPTTNSPQEYLSPHVEVISPRYVEDTQDLVQHPPYASGDRTTRKPMGPRLSKVVSDLATHGRQQRHSGSFEQSEDSLKLATRSANEDNTARDHPLYHSVTTHADGFYHCPWEGQAACQHKPEKLKCNYDKFVDSHLKPYRCKVAACESLHFSSTACLLRHEREAHAMHGHGDKPFHCTFEGCERSAPGNGFPRHWNLRDHMKRVHNNAPTSPPPSGKNKRKATDAAENPMEKAPRRANSPRTVVQVQAPKEPNWAEQYQQEYQKLVSMVEQLRDPAYPQNMDILNRSMRSIASLQHKSKLINQASMGGKSFIQQSG
ncbi:hypothetical protein HYALB_00010804 [Hymenoscyphus albidus]|uniref:C2H2-type domain-containing protein n=1 Tax=Hymenoscyphus albidus TaxID=595503 RepID=A0A9N9LVE1_9HELO|nr:hypothetical protein HYALB_00010804 [Hymenoscyphus albidus]